MMTMITSGPFSFPMLENRWHWQGYSKCPLYTDVALEKMYVTKNSNIAKVTMDPRH